MKKVTWLLFFIFCSSLPAIAGSSVWVVRSSEGTVTYLGGTCHLLRQSDHPLPKAYDQAYQQSAILAFETDIDKINSTDFQVALMKKSLYMDGTTLDKVLPPATYSQLKAVLDNAGLPIAQFKNFKPFMVFLSLLAIELQKMGVTNGAGVDQYYFNKAKADGKPTAGLEPAEAQLDFITTMSDGIEDRFIQHGLKDLSQVNQLFEELISTWREGDESKLYQFFLKDMKTDFPKLYKKLVTDRNMDWMPHITNYIKTPEKEFILVGVAHLVGSEGIVAQLKKQGYKVTKLEK